MLSPAQSIISYNRTVSAELRAAFTPLCELLSEQAKALTSEDVLACTKDFICGVMDYRSSKYDIYTQLPPSLELELAHEKLLTESQQRYLQGFLSHLNETAVLKPYNLGDLLTGKFSHYLWTPVHTKHSHSDNHAAESLVVPIGEYGIEQALLMTITSLLLLRLPNRMLSLGAKVEAEHWPLLSVETLRGSKKAEKLTAGVSTELLSTLDTLQEGIQSVQATLSSLTAKRFESLEFDELLEKIINENLAHRIALKVPFSYTLPSIRQGIYFEGIFDSASPASKKLVLSNAFTEYCKASHDIFVDSRLIVNGKRNPGLLGTGCPLAQKQIGFEFLGINYVTKAYLDTYRLVQNVVNVTDLKKQLFAIPLAKPTALSIPKERPNVLVEYNVKPEMVAKAIQHVREQMELQRLTEEILTFWFGSLPILELPALAIRERWFASIPEFDEAIRVRFADALAAVGKHKRFLNCQRTPMQTLALIILLDQFGRNLNRNSAKAYEYDAIAQGLTLSIIDAGQDTTLPAAAKWFLYMPLQHAETMALQEKSLLAFTGLHLIAQTPEEKSVFKEALGYATEHHNTIKQFGRFVHRDICLGRVHNQKTADSGNLMITSIIAAATIACLAVYSKLPKDSFAARLSSLFFIAIFVSAIGYRLFQNMRADYNKTCTTPTLALTFAATTKVESAAELSKIDATNVQSPR